MNKLLFLALIFPSFYINGSMLNSSLFMKKEVVEEVSKVATEASKWSLSCIKNAVSGISVNTVKETVYNGVKDTIQPLTTFSYENMVLAAGTATIIAVTAYKTGKYMNAIYYTPEEVKEIVTKQIDTTTRRYNPRAQ